MRSYHRPVALLSTLLFLLLSGLAACGGKDAGQSSLSDASSPSGGAQGVIHDAKLYYPFALKTFAPVHFQTPWNHPDFFNGSLLRGVCGGRDYGLSVNSSQTYGTENFDACLDLETGAMHYRYAPLPPAPYEQTISMPLSNDNYYGYLSSLSQVQEITDTLNQADASNYLKQVINSVQALSNIDTMLVSTDSEVRLGMTTRLTVTYKISTDRDVLFSFFDKTKVYLTQRQTIHVADGGAELSFMRPSNVVDVDSTSILVKLLPVGGDGSTNFAQTQIDSPSVRTDTLSFWPKDTAATLFAGQKNPIEVTWSVQGTRKIILRFLTPEKQIVQEQTLTVHGSASDSDDSQLRAIVDFDLPKDLVKGPNYSLEGHLVADGGSWDDVITRYVKDRVLTVR